MVGVQAGSYLCRARLAVWCGVRLAVGCLVGWSSFLICGTSPMPGKGGFERVSALCAHRPHVGDSV